MQRNLPHYLFFKSTNGFTPVKVLSNARTAQKPSKRQPIFSFIAGFILENASSVRFVKKVLSKKVGSILIKEFIREKNRFSVRIVQKSSVGKIRCENTVEFTIKKAGNSFVATYVANPLLSQAA